MHRLLDNLNFNLVIIELDYSKATGMPRIKKVNLSAATLLGYSKQELINKPLDLIYAPEAIPELRQTVLDGLNDGHPAKNLEVEIITKANSRIQALVSPSVLPGPQDAKAADIILLIRDISDSGRHPSRLQQTGAD
jgi:phosphoserine phosphatase RsbU/P